MKILQPLNPLKQRPDLKKTYSFDVETQNNNKDFACGSIINLYEKPKHG